MNNIIYYCDYGDAYAYVFYALHPLYVVSLLFLFLSGIPILPLLFQILVSETFFLLPLQMTMTTMTMN